MSWFKVVNNAAGTAGFPKLAFFPNAFLHLLYALNLIFSQVHLMPGTGQPRAIIT